MNSAQTELTIIERAAIAIGTSEHEARLLELAQASAGITAITNAAGYQQCHAARMVLKKTRVEIERHGKAARDDATAFSKAVIAEERRLIAIIEPEESRLQALQDDHDAKIAAEQAARDQAERERVNAIRARIDHIKRRPIAALRLDSAGVIALISEINQDGPMREDWLPRFEEFADEAAAELTASIEYLTDLRDRKIGEEAEAARLANERAEIEAQRRADEERRQAEAAERKRLGDEARAKLAAEEAEARQRREEADRAAAAERATQDRLAREAREREEAAARERLQREEAEARERREAEERAAAIARAERERIEREEAERVEAARIAQERRLAAEREAEERLRRESDEAHAALMLDALSALRADPRVDEFVKLAIAYKAEPEGTPSLTALPGLATHYAVAIGLLSDAERDESDDARSTRHYPSLEGEAA
jgi:hypothetical protein